MLDSETKRRLDTARDILVGKVPDPKSQVEQITIALIYKFMDDMDAESEELGGTRKFFAGEFARFGWPKLMRSGLGGHEMLNLYAEAIGRMPENPGIPVLFRDIFNNAYLPYRDPETLRAFLKIIDEFTYDHSERLGDAFEYLLSVLGSQGDAGQFRTPRHIIDFIVAVLDPKKSETVLDPACGTAGFLISSYKHIIAANTDDEGNSTLTPDERERLTANLQGYDISPDMVRLSLVNMYLHGFPEPHIIEYDTLTSDDRWNEYADVILANPPFMSPKGGIRPHNRFSMKSKRSEVLFVDYMAEHLTPAGRAGIIVPEGIIFQSQNAHKQLRKMLIEEYLVAVVSLPAGVFNPYSGVKTSILILDRALAKRTDRIAFFKVENDGFDLGAQRRPIDKNDLPGTEHAVKEYMDNVGNMDGQDKQDKDKAAPAPRSSMLAELVRQGAALIVEKTKIAAGGEYNLSGERYRESETLNTVYDLVPVGRFLRPKVKSIDPRNTPDEIFELWSIPAFDAGRPEILPGRDIGSAKKSVYPKDVLLSRIIPHIRRAWVVKEDPYNRRQIASTEWLVFSSNEIIPQFLQRVLVSDTFHVRFMQTITGVGGSLSRANPSAVAQIQIPVPPLEVQREIVAEIEGYQRVIDGARAVIDNYRPHIPIDPDWPMVTIGEISRELRAGFACGKTSTDSEGVPHVRPMNIGKDGQFVWEGMKYLPADKYQGKEHYSLKADDILFNNTNSKELVGKTCVISKGIQGGYSNHMTRIRTARERCDAGFLAISLHSAWRNGAFVARANKWIGQAGINLKSLAEFKIPLPPLQSQEAVVRAIELEQSIVDSNRALIQRFDKRIQAAIGRVWGEGKHG